MNKNEKSELSIYNERHLSVDNWMGFSNEPVPGRHRSGAPLRIIHSPRVVINGKVFYQESLTKEDIEFLRSKEWK